MQSEPIILDSCALIRVFDEDEPGHPEAARLGHHLVDNGIRVRVPYHALFEISATFKRKKQSGTINTYKGINETNPLQMEPVPIDEAFFSRYFDATLPYLKAGDSLFLAMGKKDGATLITEDKQLYAAAQSIGIRVFTIHEFVQHVGDKSA